MHKPWRGWTACWPWVSSHLTTKIAKRRLENERKMANQKNSPLLPNRVYLPIRLKVMVRDWATFCIQPHCSRGRKNNFKTSGNQKIRRQLATIGEVLQSNRGRPVDEVNKGVNESADITDAEYKRIMADVPLNSFQRSSTEQRWKKRCLRLAKTTVIKFRSISFLLMYLKNWSKTFPDLSLRQRLITTSLWIIPTSKIQPWPIGIKLCCWANTRMISIPKLPATHNTWLRWLQMPKTGPLLRPELRVVSKGQYEKVAGRIQNAIDAFGKKTNSWPNFPCSTPCVWVPPKERCAYVKTLQEVVIRYPKTPEETKAKKSCTFPRWRWYRFWPGRHPGGRQNLWSRKWFKALHSRHRFIRRYRPFEKPKLRCLNTTKEYHGIENLQLGENILSKEETQLILVRSFDNATKAMRYYEGVLKSRDVFIPPTIAAYEIYPITTRNYRKMMQDKSHSKYRAFFEKITSISSWFYPASLMSSRWIITSNRIINRCINSGQILFFMSSRLKVAKMETGMASNINKLWSTCCWVTAMRPVNSMNQYKMPIRFGLQLLLPM